MARKLLTLSLRRQRGGGTDKVSEVSGKLKCKGSCQKFCLFFSINGYFIDNKKAIGVC